MTDGTQRTARATSWRAWRRQFGFTLSTALGLGRRGFFIPYRYAAGVHPCAYPALEPRFAAARPRFDQILRAVEEYADDLRRLHGPAPEPRFDQDWFPRLDAAAAYTLVRRTRPQRIVEVGSGHSTRFLARAVRDAGLACEILCIDPAPRARLDGLGVRRFEALLAEVPDACFTSLEAGDILFIDSSHVLMPGSDVDRLLNGVLPLLPAGVLIHVHDVFLPDPYPETWAWRGYNEQSAIGALLQGGGFMPVFASHYVATRCRFRLAQGVLADLPLAADAFECSLWLEKQA